MFCSSLRITRLSSNLLNEWSWVSVLNKSCVLSRVAWIKWKVSSASVWFDTADEVWASWNAWLHETAPAISTLIKMTASNSIILNMVCFIYSISIFTKTPANIDNILNLGKILLEYFLLVSRLRSLNTSCFAIMTFLFAEMFAGMETFSQKILKNVYLCQKIQKNEFAETDSYHKQTQRLGLKPAGVFLCIYLLTSLLINDFYKIPITVAFMFSSIYAVAITKGLSLNDRLLQYSTGAANKNIMLMIWIFILAGAFAQSAQAMGAIDATVNLTLQLLPGNLLLAGIFLASCFISLSIGTSVGTIVALTPVAVGIAAKTDVSVVFMTAIVVGGAFFGDNLSFISDTTIAATRTQGCVMRDKFRVNSLIALPAALLVSCIMLYMEAILRWCRIFPM